MPQTHKKDLSIQDFHLLSVGLNRLSTIGNFPMCLQIEYKPDIKRFQSVFTRKNGDFLNVDFSTIRTDKSALTYNVEAMFQKRSQDCNEDLFLKFDIGR